MPALLPDGPLDTTGMYDAIVGLPEQLAAAGAVASSANELPEFAGIENILVLGVGASGIAGDVLRVTAGPFCPVPIIANHGYSLPSWVSSSTLCFAFSRSGETEETLESAQEAVHAGARVVTIGGGGRLAGLGGVHIEVDAPRSEARTALGALTAPALVVLERMGAFPGATDYIESAVQQLRRRRDELTVDNGPAERLARRIGRTMPMIYGGGGLGHVAATRWKTQINENAKAPAFVNSLPELMHNEIAGWGQHGDMTRQVFTLITLRHETEHPQVMRSFALLAEFLDEVVGSRHEITAEGDSAIAQLFDLIFYGDLVSFHLAQENEIDPGPVTVVDQVKATLRS